MDNPLFELDNCHITPHISWAPRSAARALLQTTVEHIQALWRASAKCGELRDACPSRESGNPAAQVMDPPTRA